MLIIYILRSASFVIVSTEAQILSLMVPSRMFTCESTRLKDVKPHCERCKTALTKAFREQTQVPVTTFW